MKKIITNKIILRKNHAQSKENMLLCKALAQPWVILCNRLNGGYIILIMYC